jgi:hypothetical protein
VEAGDLVMQQLVPALPWYPDDLECRVIAKYEVENVPDSLPFSSPVIRKLEEIMMSAIETAFVGL